MRIDLHVHSKFSERPSQWILQKLNCPESFTEPERLYEIALRKGMTHVTITDHNRIDGALAIAHLPHTFLSEEVTAYFPEDGCKLHVLALDITEAQHEAIQRRRTDVFDLCAYFRQERIVNIIAHPLYAVNQRLTADHFERLLLLFQNFELNGSRNSRENETLKQILNALTAADIQRLADKHGIVPWFANPHQKRLFGGSDDHSGLTIARTFTAFRCAATDADRPFCERFNAQAMVHTTAPSPQTMAHNLYGIAWQFFRRKFDLGRYTQKDSLIRFLDSALGLDPVPEPGVLSKVYCLISARKRKRIDHPLSDSLAVLLRHEAQKLIDEEPDLLHLSKAGQLSARSRDQQWFAVVNRLSSRVMLHFGNHLLDHLAGANVFNLFQTIGSAGGLTTLLAPYFVAFSQFTMGRELGSELRGRFVRPSGNADRPADGGLHVAHFTDTFYDLNGVALTLQQQVHCATAAKRRYTLITCDDRNHPSQPGVVAFAPIGTYELPAYEQQLLFYPPLLEMLDYCHRQGVSHIQTATPGPIGLAALAIARILRLPLSGTYHTEIPQYVQILTGSPFMEELAWKFMLWYYDQMDVVYVPSTSTGNELIGRGIAAEKVQVYPRGIDIRRFNPSKRNGFFRKWNCREKTIKLVYVGRVSKEKNLDLLVRAYRRLAKRFDDLLLTVVGEGPYLDEMKRAAADLPCLFTGPLAGDELAAVYASSDLFVFPSTTDTFGNVVLEAQASGIPVIVTDQGGPAENVIAGKTGLVVEADSVGALTRALALLVADPQKRQEMGAAARTYMESRSFEAAFDETWSLYEQASA